MNTSDMSPEEFETHIAKVKAERLARKLALKEKNKEHTRKRETGGKDAPVQPRAVLTEDEKRLNDLLAKKALADHEREVRALAEKQNSTVHNKDSRKSKGKGGKQK